ncbi:MAG: hypothetical protein HC927_13200, partial [Deltaproteobacteria bacterium]|nr:hypothetical protein [Deltaproteobacteria bacterium]
MGTIAYGLFADEAAADEAIENLAQHDYPEEVAAHKHVGELEDQDLQGVGTRSRSYGLIGGLIAAVIGGIVGVTLLAESLGIRPIITGASQRSR